MSVSLTEYRLYISYEVNKQPSFSLIFYMQIYTDTLKVYQMKHLMYSFGNMYGSDSYASAYAFVVCC